MILLVWAPSWPWFLLNYCHLDHQIQKTFWICCLQYYEKRSLALRLHQSRRKHQKQTERTHFVLQNCSMFVSCLQMSVTCSELEYYICPSGILSSISVNSIPMNSNDNFLLDFSKAIKGTVMSADIHQLFLAWNESFFSLSQYVSSVFDRPIF